MELEPISLERLVNEAIQDNCLSMDAASLFSQTMPVTVLVGVGPVASVLDSYARALDAELNKPEVQTDETNPQAKGTPS